MEKNELLGNLYVLRAGLSTVSCEKDKIDVELNNARNKKRNLLSEVNKSIEHAQNNVNEYNRELYYTQEREQLNSDKANKNLRTRENFMLAILLTLFLFFALAILAYVVMFWLVDTRVIGNVLETSTFFKTLYGWSVELVKTVEEKDKNSSLKAFVGLVALVVSIGAIALTVFATKRCVEGWSLLLSEKQNIRAKRTAKREQKNYAKQSQTAKDNLKAAQKKLLSEQARKKQVEQTCAEIDANTSQKVAPKIECLQNYISALDATHSSIVDIRDWENLDFIIFYIETGRADTIKEALLLVDKQRQTDQLVKAIGLATRSVCQTINVGLGRLHESMMKGFALLSDQIVLQSQIIASEMGALRSEMGSIKSSINMQSQYMQALTSEINVNNALMVKANTASLALANDVNQIRNHADYAMRKLQNG